MASAGACQPVNPGASGVVAAPIVGGTLTTDFPEVGALVHGGDFLCSLVLVAPRTAFTAGHCSYGFEGDVGPLRARFDPQIPPEQPDAGIAVAALRTHPDYGVDSSADVAVVTLAADAGVAPGRWSSEPLDDGMLGASLRLVGLGDAVFEDPTEPRRRTVVVSIDELTATHLRWDGDEGSSCHGDSGGAAYADLGTGPVLVGLLSEGDPLCAGWGSAARTDVFGPFLADPGTGDDDDDDDTGGLILGDDDDDLPPARACSAAGGPGGAALPLLPLLVAAATLRRSPRRTAGRPRRSLVTASACPPQPPQRGAPLPRP